MIKYEKNLIIILSIILIITLFIINRESSSLRVPKHEELSKIIFINFVDGKGIQKIIINREKDIKEILSRIGHSQRISKESGSDFPDKKNFISIIFAFKSGGNSFRSIHKEDSSFYIAQPSDGIYEVNKNDWDNINSIIEKGDKENISVETDDILKGRF